MDDDVDLQVEVEEESRGYWRTMTVMRCSGADRKETHQSPR